MRSISLRLAPDGRRSYLRDLRDPFGSRGQGFEQMVYPVALPSQGDKLARRTAELWRQRSADSLGTMDVAECASE